MKGGRKNLKRAVEEKSLSLADGHNIMQVVSLRGSNLIEVKDAKGNVSLAFFPAKFQKSMWIKTGNFVVVDDSGKEQALESGSKVGCIVTRVLFHEQVRTLQKSPEWPEAFKFKASGVNHSNGSEKIETLQQEDEVVKSNGSEKIETLQQEDKVVESSDDEDGLPPLEANTNRNRPYDLHEDSDSDSDS